MRKHISTFTKNSCANIFFFTWLLSSLLIRSQVLQAGVIELKEAYLCSDFDKTTYECRGGTPEQNPIFDPDIVRTIYCYTKFNTSEDVKIFHIWRHRGEPIQFDEMGKLIKTFYDDQEKTLKYTIPDTILAVVEEALNGNLKNAISIVRLKLLKSPMYRTYSSKTIDKNIHQGHWEVRILDSENNLMKLIDFNVEARSK